MAFCSSFSQNREHSFCSHSMQFWPSSLFISASLKQSESPSSRLRLSTEKTQRSHKRPPNLLWRLRQTTNNWLMCKGMVKMNEELKIKRNKWCLKGEASLKRTSIKKRDFCWKPLNLTSKPKEKNFWPNFFNFFGVFYVVHIFECNFYYD